MLVGGVRLLRMNEGSPVYAGPAWQPWAAAATCPLVPGLAAWLAERQAASVTRHARQASTSGWSRIRRWQVGMTATWRVVLLWLIVAGFCFTCAFFSTSGRLDLSVTQLILVLFPGPVATAALAQWPVNADRGLCLPVERRTFLRQVGAATALSYLELWLGASVAVASWWLLAAKPRPELADTCRALAVSFLFLVWYFGLGVWLARYRSPTVMIMSIGVSLSLTQLAIAVLYAGPAELSRSWQLPVAGVFATLGLLLAFDAYRRWLVTDLE